jgi:hypothetical protein
MSNAQAVAIWQKRNGCGAAKKTRLPAKDDSMAITVETYSCPVGRGLENVIVQGGGEGPHRPGAHQRTLATMILGPWRWRLCCRCDYEAATQFQQRNGHCPVAKGHKRRSSTKRDHEQL